MLIAAVELKFEGRIVEPGQPIPMDVPMPVHILQAHLNRRSIVDGDQSRADEIRAKHLRGLKESEEKTLKAAILKLESAISAAKLDLNAKVAETSLAEQRLANATANRKSEEEKARGMLAHLNEQLAVLSERLPKADAKHAPAKGAAPSAPPVDEPAKPGKNAKHAPAKG